MWNEKAEIYAKAYKNRIGLDTAIADIETAIQCMPEYEKQLIRKAIRPVFKSTKNYLKSRCNREMETIKSLKEKNVFCIKTDNKNSMVIIDKEEYYSRMNKTKNY